MKGPEAVRDRIDHMREAIGALRDLVTRRPGADLARDWLMMRGIERSIEIISEASRHIPDDLKGSEPDFPWRQIAGIGNIIRHEYSGVSLQLLLRVIDEDLPTLDAALLRILARLDRG